MDATATKRFGKEPYEVESILEISRFDSDSEANKIVESVSQKNAMPITNSVLGELAGFEEQVYETFLIRTDRPEDS